MSNDEALHEYLKRKEEAQRREFERQAIVHTSHMVTTPPSSHKEEIALYLHEIKGYEGLIIIDEPSKEAPLEKLLYGNLRNEIAQLTYSINPLMNEIPNNRKGRRMNKRKKK